jgi:hypothetical protein
MNDNRTTTKESKDFAVRSAKLTGAVRSFKNPSAGLIVMSFEPMAYPGLSIDKIQAITREWCRGGNLVYLTIRGEAHVQKFFNEVLPRTGLLEAVREGKTPTATIDIGSLEEYQLTGDDNVTRTYVRGVPYRFIVGGTVLDVFPNNKSTLSFERTAAPAPMPEPEQLPEGEIQLDENGLPF